METGQKGMTYKQAGVDVDLGDVCSRIMTDASRKTFANRQEKIGETEILEEEGLHKVITLNLPPYKLMMNSDGIGTKIEIAERTANHKTMAYDLIAMLADDSVRYGAEPIAATNLIDANKLNQDVIQQLSEGLVAACSAAGIANVAGEIAELGRRVGGYGNYNYNWGGTVLSILNPKRMITGKEIEAGDAIIALHEDGPRSNGLSLLRKIFQNRCGEEWHTEHLNGKTLGEHILKPSTIYTKAITHLHGGYEGQSKVNLKGIVHVTGGGIPGKFGRLLKAIKLGADLDNLYEPCVAMLRAQELGVVSDRGAYKTWHMGQGMLLVVAENEKDMTVQYLADAGMKAEHAGYITEWQGIQIASRGFFNKGVVLPFI